MNITALVLYAFMQVPAAKPAPQPPPPLTELETTKFQLLGTQRMLYQTQQQLLQLQLRDLDNEMKTQKQSVESSRPGYILNLQDGSFVKLPEPQKPEVKK